MCARLRSRTSGKMPVSPARAERAPQAKLLCAASSSRVERLMRAREMLHSLAGGGVLPLLAIGLCLAGSACKTQESSDHTNYFDRKIGPVVQQACATSPT